jgi:hypothetical protein
MFQMHRIFCATPWELETERHRFYDVVSRFNETVGMQRGVLYVPVTLTNVMDKRPMQYAVDQNIRDCRHYILLLWEDWGPTARSFRNDYHMALQCRDDPALPMESVAVFAKTQPSGQPLAEGLPEPRATFSTLAEFDECVTALMSDWLESLPMDEASTRAATAS